MGPQSNEDNVPMLVCVYKVENEIIRTRRRKDGALATGARNLESEVEKSPRSRVPCEMSRCSLGYLADIETICWRHVVVAEFYDCAGRGIVTK